MLQIRKEQMEVLEQDAVARYVRGAMQQLRSKYSDRLPLSDGELRESVLGWIADARRWGFNADPEMIRYVDFCAQTQSRREPIETRLRTYLRLYHERLLGGLDEQKLVRTVMQFASRHKVYEDEGIAWLAVILLSGYQVGDTDWSWMQPILDQSSLEEEARVLQVHQQAMARGWIASERTA